MSTPLSSIDRRELALFLLFAFAVLAVGIGFRAPWPSDEPRFVLVAQQMWASGDWLFPHRGHELYADKPPVYFWLLNLAYAGVRDWGIAFLLPSLLAALGTLLLTADLARRLWTPRAGLFAAAAVLCAVQFTYQSKRAQIDPVLVFLVTLSCYGLLRHLLVASSRRWFAAGCFAAGLGVATKGVGFLPLLMLVPYAWMRRRAWNGLVATSGGSMRTSAWGVLALLAGVGLWFVPMLATALTSGDPEHAAYLHELLYRQTATRYLDAWHHTQPVWYFAEVVVFFWLPFSLMLPWLASPWRDAWRRRDARVVLPLAWVFIVIAFFSASPGKRDMYILPALPMLALAAAPFLPAILERRGPRRALVAFFGLLGALFAVAGLWALLGTPSFAAKLQLSRGITDDETLRAWKVLATMGCTMLVGLAVLRSKRALAATALSVFILWSGYAVGIAPALDTESSGRGLMTRARAAADTDATIGLVGWSEDMLLQARGPVEEFGFKAELRTQWRDALAWLRTAPASRRVLAAAESLPACAGPGREVGSSREDWRLLDADALQSCPADPHAPDDARARQPDE